MIYSTHYRDGNTTRRYHKGALRRIVKRKRTASVVPGGHVRGYTVTLLLECGHKTHRQGRAAKGKRAHCEVCIANK